MPPVPEKLARVLKCPAAARRGKLEDGAAVARTASDRGAIEIARLVEDQAGIRALAVIPTGKAIDDLFRPALTRRRKLINRACPRSASVDGGPVEVAGLVEDNACPRIGDVSAPLFEIVENGLRPVAAAGGLNL